MLRRVVSGFVTNSDWLWPNCDWITLEPWSASAASRWFTN